MKRSQVVLSVILLFLVQTAFATFWDDLWNTKDQQGVRALKENNARQAQMLFENPDWRAVAQYRQGNYQQSLAHFDALDTAMGAYNAGNAAAHLKQYPEAIAYYDKALTMQPNFVEAKENKEIIEKLLQEQQGEGKSQDDQQSQDENQQAQSEGQSSSNNQKSKSDSSGEGQQSQDQSGKEQDHQKSPQDDVTSEAEQSSSQEGKSQGSQREKQELSSAQEQSSQEASQSSDQSQEVGAEFRDSQQEPVDAEAKATKQWLHQIPDDPGGLLRQKFLRDHRRYNDNSL